MSSHHVFAVLICVLAFAGLFFLLPTAPHSPASQSAIDISKADLAALKGRTIVDFGTAVQGVVAYSYLAEPVPEKLAASEVPEMRTESSYTKFDGVVKDGTDPTLQLTSVIYSQPAYAQDVNGQWKYLEYATTTEQAFRDRDVSLAQRIAEVFVRTAYADSVSPFAGAGDGYSAISSSSSGSPVEFDPCPQDDWLVVHDAVAGTGSNFVADSTAVQASGYNIFDAFNISSCNANIYRSFFPFDTSAISSAATISAATLNLNVWLKTDTSLDGYDYVTVVRTSQATHTAVTNADYDQCGAVTTPTEGIDSGERKTISAIATATYLVFTLNATGRGWIAKSGVASNCSATAGITCLGVRTGHDTQNIAMNISDQIDDSVNFYTSEKTGTTEDPYLSVTYSIGSAQAAKSGMKISSNGKLKVTSGGLKIK